MSADNTIAILVTRNRRGEGLEFRVAHVQALENYVYEPDYPRGERAVMNYEWTRRLFADAPYFTDAAAAMRYAFKLERRISYVEYGVRLLNHSDVNFPASAGRRAWRRWQREADSSKAAVG